MTILDAIAFGAASSAVGAAVYLAQRIGEHTQELKDHDRRLDQLEGHYQTIGEEIHQLRELIQFGNGR